MSEFEITRRGLMVLYNTAWIPLRLLSYQRGHFNTDINYEKGIES